MSTEPVVRDSGEREVMSTGSQRDTAVGKGRMDLLMFGVPLALRAVSRHFEEGAKKYLEHNWMLGQPLSRYFRSAQNHLNDFAAGDRVEPHLISAIWNLLCMVETYFLIEMGLLPEELNDLIVPVVVYEDVIKKDGDYQRVIPRDGANWQSVYGIQPSTDEQIKQLQQALIGERDKIDQTKLKYSETDEAND